MAATDTLFTHVEVPDFRPKIRYGDGIALTGSCFSEHIGRKLQRYKYDVLINPFGILYNPVSMAGSLERIAGLTYYTLDDLVLHDGLYHSMDHHGSFSGKQPEEVLKKINTSLEEAHHFIQRTSFYFISPGTAKVYAYTPTGHIAGNCHKIPQHDFRARRLSLQECESAFEKITHHIRQLSPEAIIIWTVSPVRHLRDGLIENQRSKSTLILATDTQLKRDKASGYFPAYEIMTDELRDYRFYARDLTHPTDVAIDSIWERFAVTYLDPHEREHHGPIEKIKRAMEHRFLHDDREEMKKFAAGQLKQIDAMAAKLPDLNWQAERQYFFHLLEQD